MLEILDPDPSETPPSAPELALRKTFPRALRPASDLAQGSILPPPPLWDGFLLRRTLTMLSAPGGVGKSWFMLSMMASLESGQPLCDTWVPHAPSGRCLYIGLDSAPWDLCKQWSAIARAQNLAPATIQSDMLLRGGERIDLLAQSDWIRSWVQAVAPDVIFVDNLRQAFLTLNENDSAQVEIVMSRFREWRDLGSAVIFSHHTRKPPIGPGKPTPRDSARGSGALHDAVDFHLALEPLTPDSFRLTIAKGRDDLSAFGRETILKRVHSTLNNLPAVSLVPIGPGGNYAPLLAQIVTTHQNGGISTRATLIQSLAPTFGPKAPGFVNNGLHKLASRGLIQPGPTPHTWIPL